MQETRGARNPEMSRDADTDAQTQNALRIPSHWMRTAFHIRTPRSTFEQKGRIN
jgi:hypothetical protein